MTQKTSTLNTILLVIVIILLAVGIWAILSSKKSTENVDYNFPTSADITNGTSASNQALITTPSTPGTVVATKPTQSSTSSNELSTYSNSANGFSFKYPSRWKVIPDPLNSNQIKITTDDTMGGVDGGSYPSYAITFKVTDKTFFNQPNSPVQTKYGEITYDQNRNSILIDGQCRRAEGIEGSSVQGVRYGGSLMSDPAYGDSAIVTINKSIIIVHTEMGVTPSDATRAQIKAIFDSFTLLNGNKIFIPVCN